MCISAHFFRKKERERKRQQRAGLLTAAITTTLSSGIGKGEVGLATPKTPGSVISEIRRFVMIGVRFADSWVGVEEWGARRRMAGEAREEQASNRMGSWTEEEEAYLHLDSLGDFLGIQKGEQTEIFGLPGMPERRVCRLDGREGWRKRKRHSKRYRIGLLKEEEEGEKDEGEEAHLHIAPAPVIFRHPSSFILMRNFSRIMCNH
jgi:hypothetical protein